MKAKIKDGANILFMPGNKWNDFSDKRMIINFNNKYTYINFSQKKNHILINTTEGLVDIVFASEIPILEYESFCKDQLILKLI